MLISALEGEEKCVHLRVMWFAPKRPTSTMLAWNSRDCCCCYRYYGGGYSLSKADGSAAWHSLILLVSMALSGFKILYCDAWGSVTSLLLLSTSIGAPIENYQNKVGPKRPTMINTK